MTKGIAIEYRGKNFEISFMFLLLRVVNVIALLSICYFIDISLFISFRFSHLIMSNIIFLLMALLCSNS